MYIIQVFGYRQNTLDITTAKYNTHIGYKAQELFSSSYSQPPDGNSSHNILIGPIYPSGTTYTNFHNNILIEINQVILLGNHIP